MPRKNVKPLQVDDLIAALEALGSELEARNTNEPIRILLVGGACLLLTIGNRAFTEDIDIFPLNFDLSTHEPESQQMKVFRIAARAVAKKRELRQDWINDVAASMLGGLGPEPEVHLWRQFSQLHVFLPDLECILAMKLFAGREKDEADILALCEHLGVVTREQAQAVLDKYVYPRWQKEYRVSRTLDALF